MKRRSGLAAMVFLALGALPASGDEPWFADVAADAGVARPHQRRVFENPYAEVMQGYTALGAAAAVADFDGDGWEDLFVTDSAADGRNRLYRNLGGWRFAEATQVELGSGNDARNASADALFLDYDNDGWQDLLVVRFGQSQLFRNQGGRFRDVTREAGLERRLNSIGALAFDADGDGWLDLLLGNYFSAVDLFDPATPRFFPESFEAARNGGGLTFYRNRGPDGSGRVSFAEATAAAGLAQSGWTLDLGHGDADGDGDQDLYVACDFGSDRFLVNDGRGVFRDVTAEAIGGDTKKGMNAEWGDYDGDGRLDVFVTNITDDYMREGNFLWRNAGRASGPSFIDVARETGVDDSGWGWGGKFLDYDNDGWQDLYVADGWVSAGAESYVPVIFEFLLSEPDLADARNWPPMGGRSLSGHQRNRLFRNLEGELFRDEAARHGVDSERDGRGVAVADFDRDGRLDLLVTNAGAAPHLFRNRAPAAAWASFALAGRSGGRDAVGAALRATAAGRARLDFVDGGNGFAAQSSRRVHFGLGGAARVEALEVEWPSGLRQRLAGVPAGRFALLVEEPAGGGGATLAALEEALAADPGSLPRGDAYRRAALAAGEHDRAIAFFEKLAAAPPGGPEAAGLWLNFGYAYVDKIPTAGSITQVLLANSALRCFDQALARERSWLALYTRGNSYLYWPKVFGRGPLAVADLEEAVALSRALPPRRVFARAHLALGDAYWRVARPEQARAAWREGAQRFPGEAGFGERLRRDGAELEAYIYALLDPNLPVDTDLRPLWEEP